MKTNIILFIFLSGIYIFAASPALILHMEDGTRRELNLLDIKNIEFTKNQPNELIIIWTKDNKSTSYSTFNNTITFMNLGTAYPSIQTGNKSYQLSDIDSITIGSYNEIKGIYYNKAIVEFLDFSWEYHLWGYYNDALGDSDYDKNESDSEKKVFNYENEFRTNNYYDGQCQCMGNYPTDYFSLCGSTGGIKSDNYGTTRDCQYDILNIYIDTSKQVIDSIKGYLRYTSKFTSNYGVHYYNKSNDIDYAVITQIPYQLDKANNITATITYSDLAKSLLFKEHASEDQYGRTYSGSDDKELINYKFSQNSKIKILIYK